jgi:hypothetical protein
MLGHAAAKIIPKTKKPTKHNEKRRKMPLAGNRFGEANQIA